MAEKPGSSSIQETSSKQWSMARDKKPPLLQQESTLSSLVTKSIESSENIKLEGETDFEKVKEIMARITKRDNVVRANAKMDKKIVLTFDSSRGRTKEAEEAEPDGEKQANKPKKSKRVIHVKTRGTITEPPTIIINTGTDMESPLQPSVKIGTPAVVTTNKHILAVPSTADTHTSTEHNSKAEMATSTYFPEKVDSFTETDAEVLVYTRTVGVGESVGVTTRGVGESIKVRDSLVNTENIKTSDVMTNTEYKTPLYKDMCVDAIPKMLDKELSTRVETRTRSNCANYKPEQSSKLISTEDPLERVETGISTDFTPVNAMATMTYLTTYREKGQTANIPDNGVRERVNTLKKEIKVLYEHKKKMQDVVQTINITKRESEGESSSECSFTDLYCQCCSHECGIRESRLCDFCRMSYNPHHVDVSVRSKYRVQHPQTVHTLLESHEETKTTPLRIQIPPKGRAVRVRTPSTHADGEYRFIQFF